MFTYESSTDSNFSFNFKEWVIKMAHDQQLTIKEIAPELFFHIFYYLEETDIKKICVLYQVNKHFYNIGELYFESHSAREFSIMAKLPDPTNWLGTYRKAYNTQYIDIERCFRDDKNKNLESKQSSLIRYVKLGDLNKIKALNITLIDWIVRDRSGRCAVTYAAQGGFIAIQNYAFDKFVKPQKDALFKNLPNSVKLPWIDYDDALIAFHQAEEINLLKTQLAKEQVNQIKNLKQEIASKKAASETATIAANAAVRAMQRAVEEGSTEIDALSTAANAALAASAAAHEKANRAALLNNLLISDLERPKQARLINFHIRTAIENNNITITSENLDINPDVTAYEFYEITKYDSEDNSFRHDSKTGYRSGPENSYIYYNENITLNLVWLVVKYERLEIFNLLLQKFPSAENEVDSDSDGSKKYTREKLIVDAAVAAMAYRNYQWFDDNIFPLLNDDETLLAKVFFAAIKEGWSEYIEKTLNDTTKKEIDIKKYSKNLFLIYNTHHVNDNIKCHEIMFKFFLDKKQPEKYYQYFYACFSELKDFKISDYRYYEYFLNKLVSSPDCYTHYVKQLKKTTVQEVTVGIISNMIEFSTSDQRFLKPLKEFLKKLSDSKVNLKKGYPEDYFEIKDFGVMHQESFHFFNAAVEMCDVELVKLLLTVGIDPTISDQVSPLSFVEEKLKENQAKAAQAVSDPDMLSPEQQNKLIEDQHNLNIISKLFAEWQSANAVQNTDNDAASESSSEYDSDSNGSYSYGS